MIMGCKGRTSGREDPALEERAACPNTELMF